MFFYLVRFLLAVLLLANRSSSVPVKQNHALYDAALSDEDDMFGSSFQPDNSEFDELRFSSNEIDSRNWKRSLPEPVTSELITNTNDNTSVSDESAITRYQIVSSEQDDMLHSAVTPDDEDPVDDAENSAQIQPRTFIPESTSSASKREKTVLSVINTSLPPMIFPNDEDVKSIANVSKDIVEKMNETIYDTIKSDPESTFNSAHVIGSDYSPVASSSSTNMPNVFLEQNGEPNAISELRNKSENNFNTLGTSLTTRINEMKGLEKVNNMKVVSKENGENSKESTSSTTVTVITTLLALAVVVVIGYVGIIAWKRYLRNHYWNRELLINDLEIDINDLHHFEL